MIAFVTSLRNPLNSDSYQRVEHLLKLTLDSVCAQSDDDFVVIIVGNRPPAFTLPRKTHFVEVDFPPPTTTPGPRTELGPFVWDKGTKIGIGLVFARRFEPDHVMIFDADDFVSRQIAAFVNSHKESPGWVIDAGWMYSSARKVFRKVPEFNRTCGTSFVIPYRAYGVPYELDVHATQDQVAAGFGEKLYRILGAHRDAQTWHAEQGRILESLPFRGAVYHVDTGENHSGKTMQGLARPSTVALRHEFGVPDQSRLMSSLWRSINVGGPRVIAGLVAARAKEIVRSLTRRTA